jgi:hypothetical protein
LANHLSSFSTQNNRNNLTLDKKLVFPRLQLNLNNGTHDITSEALFPGGKRGEREKEMLLKRNWRRMERLNKYPCSVRAVFGHSIIPIGMCFFFFIFFYFNNIFSVKE